MQAFIILTKCIERAAFTLGCACGANTSSVEYNPVVRQRPVALRNSFLQLLFGLVHILGIGLTGTSVNPARSIAPAIFAAAKGNMAPLASLWVFIVGPLVGAALAALVNKKVIEA